MDNNIACVHDQTRNRRRSEGCVDNNMACVHDQSRNRRRSEGYVDNNMACVHDQSKTSGEAILEDKQQKQNLRHRAIA